MTVIVPIELRTLATDPQQKYYLYAPERIDETTNVFVTVHGISQNAYSHAQHFLLFAQMSNSVLISPLFEMKRFPNYNSLGCSGQEMAHDQLNLILDDVSEKLGVNTQKIFLFGYSAGGQFAHRYSLLYPERIKKLSIGAPGYFTLPTDKYDYPFGLNGFESCVGSAPKLEEFLKIPTCVVVGADDVQRTPSLLQGLPVDEIQGFTRVERGKLWFNFVSDASFRAGNSTEYLFRTLPGCPHSFELCMEHGRMGETVFHFFELLNIKGR